MDPKFSILVPTRQRPDTLLATLATLIWHPGDDYEIVVADNCGDDEVAAVIQAAQQRHPRIHHIRSDRVLPMAINWERGLAACRGEYVSVLGDDDGFLPSTLDVARKVLALTDARVFSWEMHTYWWPDTIAHWNRNRLYATLGRNDVLWVDSRPTLVNTYVDPASFGHLPMIYNAFVHRDIINAVIDRFGAYFVPPELSPDVTSGIINLVYTSRYLHSLRPLAVRGNSRRSTGTSFWVGSLGREQQSTYLREEGKTIEELTHSSLIASRSLAICLASIKLHIKDLLFPHDPELQIDLRTVVRLAIGTLNMDADAYDENLRNALQLADRIGLAVDPSSIPAKSPAVRNRLQGPIISGNSVTIGIDCDMANVSNIAGAARLAEALSPELNVRVVETAVAEPERKAG
jgi:glycosyltransferase involved in cell wall biosynthesis